MNRWKEIIVGYSSGPNPIKMPVWICGGVGGRDEVPDMFVKQLRPWRMCQFLKSFVFLRTA